MPETRFIQVHALHSYPAALLNRDDSGLAKRIPYGGHIRTRISSQCLKRHWREAEGPYALTNITADAVRTKAMASHLIAQNLDDFDPEGEIVAAALEQLNIGLYGPSGNDANARQGLLFGQPEIAFLTERTQQALAGVTDADEVKANVAAIFTGTERLNFSAMRQCQSIPAGLVGAMFGRMVTSDVRANIDASIHVAHAFTVHPEEAEIDFFTSMEELAGNGRQAAHLGTTEINSGIYYVYVCMDIPTLVSNTAGVPADQWLDADRSLAAAAAGSLAGLIATVSPGAKKGSTAPYGYAQAMLVEAGARQPRSLASAFREPAGYTLDQAARKLTTHLASMDETYGPHETRWQFAMPDAGTDSTLDDIVKNIHDSIDTGSV